MNDTSSIPGSLPSGSQWELLRQGRAPRPRLRRALAFVALAVALAALGAGLAYQCQLVPRTGVVARIDQGSLEARDTAHDPWVAAREGQAIREGTRLRTGAGTKAALRFFDSSVMRVESRGEWWILRLQGSRNERLSRIVVRQRQGRASFVSAPAHGGADALLRLQVPGATMDLLGTVVVTTLEGGQTEAHVSQGVCRVYSDEQPTEVAAGFTAIINPPKPLAILATMPTP